MLCFLRPHPSLGKRCIAPFAFAKWKFSDEELGIDHPAAEVEQDLPLEQEEQNGMDGIDNSVFNAGNF